jgi:hypothetical protein
MGGACSAYEVRESCVKILVVERKETDHWRDLGIDGRIILRRIFMNWDVGIWAGLSWLRIDKGDGHL